MAIDAVSVDGDGNATFAALKPEQPYPGLVQPTPQLGPSRHGGPTSRAVVERDLHIFPASPAAMHI